MSNNNYFVSTRKANGLYRFIFLSSKLNAEKQLNLKLEPFIINKKYPSLKFIFFFFYCLLTFKLFSKRKLIFLKYRKCDIGAHAASQAYKETSSWNSKVRLYINLLKYFFIGGAIIDNGYSIVKKSAGIYIDHAGYLNGLYFKIFSMNQKLIYNNTFPRGLYFINYKKKNNRKLNSVKDSVRIFSKKKIIKKNIISKNRNYLRKVILNPNKYISYMTSCRYEQLKDKIYDFSKTDYIVYTHSFVDGQLWYGNDGFSDLLDWLEFTLKELKKRDKFLVVKAHPNFFNPILGKVNENDKKIFLKLKQQFSSDKIYFLDYAVKNYDLLKKVPKKTILISHHGSALIEGTFLGYKTICSVATIWNPKMRISNQWSNLNKYKKLLNLNWAHLKSYNKNDFFDLTNQLYFNQYMAWGKLSWINTVRKKMDKKITFKYRTPVKPKIHEIANSISDKSLKKITRGISKNIEEIYGI